MSSSRPRRRETCAHEGCGSRRFHIGGDGYTYCDQGHQQRERGAVIAEDTGELNLIGKKSRRKDSDAESSTSRASAFSGADALEHYLLCLQLVLWKQLRWLIEVQKLPQELEVLVKDLWALRLQKLQGRIVHDSETDTEAPLSQVFSSQSESESASASQSTRRSRRNQAKPKEGTATLLETLSLCYIGILLLRVPITVADIHGWISDGELLYYRSAREIPLSMRERLPPEYQKVLGPQDVMHPSRLQEAVLEMFALFNVEFGMALPSINTPLIVMRWMKELMLPLELFAGTQRLASLLEIDVKYDISKTRTRLVWRCPEVQLMALLVVATKLLFPFNKRRFKTNALTDLSAVPMDWDKWVIIHDKLAHVGTEDQMRYEKAFSFTEAECLDAPDDKLDAYLGWCERNIASEDIRSHDWAAKDAVFRRALFEMFPLHAHDDGKSRIRSVAPTNEYMPPVSGHRLLLDVRPTNETAPKSVPSVGNFYRRYRHVDELHGPAKILFENAAKLACVSLDDMIDVVFLTEKKLEKVEIRLKKTEAEGV